MDTDILISDYSSTYIDYLLLDRPLIFYNFDYEDYLQNDREMYYDYDEVTPGYKAATFDELMTELDSIAKDEDHFVEDRQRVSGMVKDDNHRTRGLYYNNEEIMFPPNSEAFLLVTRIQDEAHRFAIEYHRSLRAKGQVHSVLDDIKGVGPKRRKELMKYFKDISQIKTAEIEELLNVPGMNQSTAQAIYEFFHVSK